MPAKESDAILRSALLSDVPWLWHGFSTRGTDLARSERRQRAFGRAVAGEAVPVVVLRQVHGSAIWRDPAPGTAGDGQITTRRGKLLAVRTADCCPILLVDLRRRALAAVHAGWRGTLARIAEKAVGEMRAGFGTRPEDVRAAIGPSMRGCCYEVGEEVREAFRARFADADEYFEAGDDDPVRSRYPMLFMTAAPPGHPPDAHGDARFNPGAKLRLDVAEANRRQLLAAGIRAEAIEVLPYCTGCRPDLFFSHRRGESGRMLAVVGMRPGPAGRPRTAVFLPQ